MTDFADDNNEDLDARIVDQDEKQVAETNLLKRIESGDDAAITKYAERFRKNHLRALQDEAITFFVKLQEENPAAWFMLRQRLQQAKIKISSIDKLIKKRIEEKCAKETQERAARAAAGPSPAELKQLEMEKNNLRATLWNKCQHIAQSPTLMADFVSVAHRYGVVAEEHAIKTAYLSATSRLAIKEVLNMVREGAAAGGKSFVTDNVLDLIPKEDVIELTTTSPMALIYKGGDDADFLKHKIISIAEAVALAEKKDGSEPNPFATMLRTLISKGFITHDVVVLQKKGLPITVTVTRNGPTVAMTTTARDNIDDELRTRLVSSKADESRGQTVEIIKRTFSTNPNPVTVEEKENWIAHQRWLALDGPYEVAIPYLDVIGDTFGDLANDSDAPQEYPLRARRDATALKAAIGASAILHKAQRERDGSGRIVATFDDYRLAHIVVDFSTAEAHHLVIPETALAVVEAIEKIGEGRTQAIKVTVRTLQKKLGVSSVSIAYQRLYEALDLGLIEVDERPDGKPYAERGPRYYRIVSSSDETKVRIKKERALRVFPTADEIARCASSGRGGRPEHRTEKQERENGRKSTSDQVDSSVRGDKRTELFEPLKKEQRPEQSTEGPPLFDDEASIDPLSHAPQAENPPLPVANLISGNNADKPKPGWRGRI
jgi:hypothetical protein